MAVSTVWKGDWKELTRSRGSGALPAAWYLARNYAGMRLAELGEIAGGVTYPAVSTAIKRSAFAEAFSVVSLTRDYGGQDGATSSNDA
jgi:hypothetical protein